VVPPVSTCVVRGPLAPSGKDADPQESLWDFKWSRGEAGGEAAGRDSAQPGGDQRPPGGVPTCVWGHKEGFGKDRGSGCPACTTTQEAWQ